MSEFGYITDVEQSYFNNKGIFTPTDIYNLNKQDKWTMLGQLELINTTNASAINSIIWSADDLAGYDVHFLTYNDVEMFDASTNDYLAMYLSFDGGSSYPYSSYHRASHLWEGTSHFESKSTNEGKFRLATHGGDNNNETKNGYVYIYNFLDSTKFTFLTSHSSCAPNANTNGGEFSGLVNEELLARTHLKFQNAQGTAFDGNISMYGIRLSS